MSRVMILGSALEAVADTPDGATVLIGGFGAAGQPVQLIEALLASDARDLTVVSNNAGNGDHGLAALIRDRRIRAQARASARSSPRPVSARRWPRARKPGSSTARATCSSTRCAQTWP